MSAGLPRAPLSESELFAVEYDPASGEVVMLDQRLLPTEVVFHRYRKPDQVADAIRTMVVRGAPAIGIAAAYAFVLLAQEQDGDARSFLLANGIAGRVLGATRPTAVNLAWAIARMARRAGTAAQLDPAARLAVIREEAEAIHREDVLACKAIGALGAASVPDGARILTHCNAGALATGGYGTALGVVRAAHAQGKRVHVFASETRPYLQGARLTSFELHRDGIPVEVVTDGMSGHLFARGEIDFVVVGADRIAANGDVANKIGTYTHAVLAAAHGVPFTVAAPKSTLDPATPTGASIPIEERSRDEVVRIGEKAYVADGIGVRHPAFDVTPARLVDTVFTEVGAFSPKRGDTLATLARA